MSTTLFNSGLFNFLSQSPTSFHAAGNMKDLFVKAGYNVLDEKEEWQIRPSEKHVLIRNDGAIIAFHSGSMESSKTGFRITGAHTDSPGLKIRTMPDMKNSSAVQLGVEVYGGPILSTWFDRELSIAGRVSFVKENKSATPVLTSEIIDFKKPVAIIPNLAIHLDRDVNSGRNINRQNDLPPVLALDNKKAFNFRDHLVKHMKKAGHKISDENLIDFDLMLYDPKEPSTVGMNNELITSGRLDNLVSCYCGTMAMIDSESNLPAIFIANDHEEVGSVSTSGAAGNFLLSFLERICPEPEKRFMATAKSFMISADNAHGIHPNFKDRYEPNHAPVLNNGPVLKYNAGQRYATNSLSAAVFRYICIKEGIPFQEYAVRADMACGSTIGPVTSGNSGILTADAGIPMLAMHSIRETAGVKDAETFKCLLEAHIRTEISLS